VVVMLRISRYFGTAWHRRLAVWPSGISSDCGRTQRGYNGAGKPSGVRWYALLSITSDVIAIADQLGPKEDFSGGGTLRRAVAWSDGPNSSARIAGGDSECRTLR